MALFAHCFTCSKESRAARRISSALADERIATLRFDFTGLGESEGEHADSTFSSTMDDLVDVAGWLREHLGGPTILVGHSLGGAAVLGAAHRIEEVRAIATVGAPADPIHVKSLFGESLETTRPRARGRSPSPAAPSRSAASCSRISRSSAAPSASGP